MLFLGIYSTMMLNVSDYSRELEGGVKRGPLTTIYAMSILPCTLFMGLIGLMVSGATGVADPIQVFSSAVDNKPLLIATLLFITFAQVTTNVLNNVVPPTYVLMDVFKLSFRSSAIIVGLLAFGTFPWELVKDESAAGLQLFVQTYSAFLGPIFAVLVVDYYIIRRRNLNLSKLYDENGPYRGVNYAGIVASLVGAAVALGFSSVSWYASLIPAGLSYWLLMNNWGACRRFLEN
jgi:NCS1 family nucleobase:cation symporter-1